MSRKPYQVDEVIKSLSTKNDIFIDVKNKDVFILRDKVLDKKGNIVDNPEKKNDLGNKSWGKIDFLTNHSGFSGPWKIDTFKKERK